MREWTKHIRAFQAVAHRFVRIARLGKRATEELFDVAGGRVPRRSRLLVHIDHLDVWVTRCTLAGGLMLLPRLETLFNAFEGSGIVCIGSTSGCGSLSAFSERGGVVGLVRNLYDCGLAFAISTRVY